MLQQTSSEVIIFRLEIKFKFKKYNSFIPIETKMAQVKEFL